MKTAKVTIGEQEYEFTPFTVGQLEQIGDFGEGVSTSKAGFLVFCLACENATPPIPDPRKMIASPAEIMAVVNAVNAITGIEQDKPEGEARPAG